MTRRSTSRRIHAPAQSVFAALTNIEKLPEKNPDIVKIEILSDQKSGVGTRFRETRRMKKREASTELEITEYVENERVRFVSDAGGAIWDSMYRLTPADGATNLNLEMEARPYKFMARLMIPMIIGMVAKAVEDDMDAVKAYCERAAGR